MLRRFYRKTKRINRKDDFDEKNNNSVIKKSIVKSRGYETPTFFASEHPVSAKLLKVFLISENELKQIWNEEKSIISCR